MRDGAGWLAANGESKGWRAEPAGEWVRSPGETWFRRVDLGPEPSRALFRHRLITTARVLGAPVCSAIGQRLGRISEIALDETSGAIAFVVISKGGFLGLGARRTKAPWSALAYDRRLAGYVLLSSPWPVGGVRQAAADSVALDPTAHGKD